ncbi:YlxR family protein [Stackebrandtia soli]|uniref:YlxR family protein n=1 Tax=Stackebrandtia soli TaxID=1892856 RepID=UPI0039EA3C1F
MVRRAEVIRTCVGCRVRASASELLRVVAVADTVSTGVRLVPDPVRRRTGRGAHVHPVLECLTQALRKRAFGRALRLSERYDVTELETFVADHTIRVTREVDGGHTGVRPRKQGR